MVHVRALASGIGVRQAGSGPERRAAAYIAGRLESWGYDADIRTFPLPKGRTSQNVVATLKGASARTIILGAHYDTKRPSPGANDNGTGTAALLEIARDLRDRRPDVTIRLVFFGSEERVDSDSDHHHFGSRAYVASMTRAERARTIGMVSIDMIGFGPDLHVRTMGRGPQTLRRKLLAFAGSIGTKITYKADTASTGSSDHEAFERAGIPAAWIEWRDDPVYHTSRDVASHVSAVKMRTVGRFVLAYVRSL
jgi:aminopeptidase YwaD